MRNKNNQALVLFIPKDGVCISGMIFLLYFFCSGETDMNLCGSLPNHENRNIFDGTPPQGLSEARRAGFF